MTGHTCVALDSVRIVLDVIADVALDPVLPLDERVESIALLLITANQQLDKALGTQRREQR